MGRVLILSEKEDLSAQLRGDMESADHSTLAAGFDNAAAIIHTRKPDLILVDLTLQGGIIEVWRQLKYELEDTHTRAIVLIPRDRIREMELLEGMTDFVIYPYDVIPPLF